MVAREQPGARYLTLDDPVTLSAARADPAGFLAGLPQLAIIDEVQRAPELFLALKAGVAGAVGRPLGERWWRWSRKSRIRRISPMLSSHIPSLEKGWAESERNLAPFR